jgi:alanyl-tRNA synthetase
MNSNEIRAAFLDFYQKNAHTIVPTSSLIPHNDQTLLFVNSGMVQFKDVFLGIDQRPYTRATTAQRCVRAGGKHNDLENVGYTKRHHTFFEMLGNFSFGDYFKREAISFAWKLLTEVFKIPQDRLWVTVFKEDKETENIWLNEMKISPDRFSRCGEKDNFWQMGDTGPCGPCTEIFYDHGPEIPGGPPGSLDEDGDRYVEIWNLVFMQYNRDITGALTQLPKPSVDTGMGLERVASVLQGVHDNYDIDIFQHLLSSLSKIVHVNDFANTSMRVIVDHIRSCSFLVVDGVVPSNEGRGYVLRRIIRRAIRHGYKLGKNEPFFHKMVKPLIEIMGNAYPELKARQSIIEELLLMEEEQFASTLEKGLKIFDHEVKQLKTQEIPGKVVFTLYDTYGFPPDLTADIARERHLTIDHDGFEAAMEEQRAQSQASQQFSMERVKQLHINGETAFTGYENLSDEGKTIALFVEEKPVNHLKSGEMAIVVLDRTPFYAESGGQVGDSGYIYYGQGRFRVKDTQKLGRVYLHYGQMEAGELPLNSVVKAEVDPSRQAIVLNHSATHLLHEALRRILGEHVMQKGSLVEARRLRFDFTHTKPVTMEQLQAIEQMVNQEIRANNPTHLSEGSIDQARDQGALALFGEKYADVVRVIKMGEFSKEVCGGTHVSRAGDIGLFKIISESAVASGIRRIEAFTGLEALLWVERNESELDKIADILKVKRESVVEKIDKLIDHNRQLEKTIDQYKQQMANQQSGSLASHATKIDGIQVLATQLNSGDTETLRKTMDNLKQELGEAAIVLSCVNEDKIQMIAGVTKGCLSYFNATQLLNQVATQVGGKGGGRPDFAQGGGDKPQELPAALASVVAWVREKVQNAS